jgi:uncharacterized damage-inducible protein DinB
VNVADLLTDLFDRLPDSVRRVVDGLTPEQLIWAPEVGANSIGWTVWHLTRVQDDHVAEVMGVGQLWSEGDWASRFGLSRADPNNTGYGHKPDEVASIKPTGPEALVDYYTAVHARTHAYIRTLDEAALDRVVDERWDPPVTLGVRLISVADDDAQHIGQAAYVRGLMP